MNFKQLIKINIILALYLMQYGLYGQDTETYNKVSIEFSHAYYKVGNWDDLIYDGSPACDDCIETVVTNEGFEHSSKLTLNFRLNQKNVILGGFGINTGKYNFDEYNWYEGTMKKLQTQNYILADIVIGHRYVFSKQKNASFYFENFIHNEVNINEYFEKYKFRFSTGVGFKYSVNKKLSLLSSFNLNRVIIGDQLAELKYGIRIGLNHEF